MRFIGWFFSSRRVRFSVFVFEVAFFRIRRSVVVWRSSVRSWLIFISFSISFSRISSVGIVGAISSSGSRRLRLVGCRSARGSVSYRRICC